MTKRDYERATTIVQGLGQACKDVCRWHVEQAFVELFRNDNPHFDETKFRASCTKE